MELNDFIIRLEGLNSAIRQANVRNLMLAGADAADMIIQRVQESGIDSEGNAYDDYSPQYKKFRDKNNKRTDIRNFTFGGDMMRSVDAQLESTDSGAVVVVGARGDDRDKMKYNVERDGPIIALTEEEKKQITEDVLERYRNDFARLLTGQS